MDIVQKVKKLASNEAKKYNSSDIDFEIVEKKALELASIFHANKTIVLMGIYLMDIKAPEAFHQGEEENHTKMGIEVTKEFLMQINLDEKAKGKIINCVEAHHKDVPFICKEAEICANADCYRFLHPKGFLKMFACLERISGFEKALNILDQRLDEKYNKILSLDICKQELGRYYPLIKRLIKSAGKV